MPVTVRPVHRDYTPINLRDGILILLVGLVVGYLCVVHFCNAYRQNASQSFPSVWGRMTEYRWEKWGAGAQSGSELVVTYAYTVRARLYENSRFRYVWRPVRAGVDIPQQRALTWGLGHRVEIFYNPVNPADSLLDKGMCLGDWLFLCGIIAAVLLALPAFAYTLYWDLTIRHPSRARPARPRVAMTCEGDVTRIRLPKATPYAMNVFGLATGVAVLLPPALFAVLGRCPADVLPYLVGITVALLVIGVYLFVTERQRYGPGEFCLTISRRKGTITLPGLQGEPDVTVPFDKVQRIWLDITGAKFTELAHTTFDPCVVYVDESGAQRTAVVAKYLFRNRGQDLVRILKEKIPDCGSADLGAQEPFTGSSGTVPLETHGTEEVDLPTMC